MKTKLIIIGIIFLSVVLFPISAFALSTEVHVPEKYTNVSAGDRFYFELDIQYPENPSREDLHLEYDITKNGETIAQSQVLKAVETQASFMDYVVIPDSAESGLYNINIKISDYAKLNESTSASFNVVGKDNQLLYYFLALVGVIIAFGIFIMIEIKRLTKK